MGLPLTDKSSIPPRIPAFQAGDPASTDRIKTLIFSAVTRRNGATKPYPFKKSRLPYNKNSPSALPKALCFQTKTPENFISLQDVLSGGDPEKPEKGEGSKRNLRLLFDDLLAFIETTVSADAVRHFQLSALAAFGQTGSLQLPDVGASLVSAGSRALSLRNRHFQHLLKIIVKIDLQSR